MVASTINSKEMVVSH